jgi:hypothetical protein
MGPVLDDLGPLLLDAETLPDDSVGVALLGHRLGFRIFKAQVAELT